jgi:adenine-specific DNA-methyltransferase
MFKRGVFMAQQKLELTWYGKENDIKVEPRLLIENSNLSYCKTDDGLFSFESLSDNVLIHGDNLIALKSLEKQYSNKIKLIYIDPPYNTGAAFEHYDDNLEHSKWLSLMKERIIILRRLLRDDGFFVVHIDDVESSYLKVMCDEIFGRDNYLTTLYVQVRYPGKTLAEDSDYQKVIEQCHVYSKNRINAKINRPSVEYSIEKFKWEIIEESDGTEIELGGKKVKIFKLGEYSIRETNPSLNGLKETWATGSLARVRASAGEFFELYLQERKELDGLGTLYKVYGMGEDGLGYRYISGPRKETAKKGKFYSGIPLKRVEELKNGKSLRHLPVPNFYDFAGSFGNCRLEGGVDFRGGKKPEAFLKMIIEYFSNENDVVLDSFLGSGSTIAAAHKMKRQWIGIELGDQAYTHCKPRMDSIINGKDKTGISKEVNWISGGGYRFYEIAPSLILKDDFDQDVINSQYNADMLVSAIALHEGYKYEPDQSVFWKQAKNGDSSYLFTTTKHLDRTYLDAIHSQMNDDEFLVVSCKSFESNIRHLYKNISIKKIPQSLLKNCEFGVDNYNLNIINPPVYEEDDEDE